MVREPFPEERILEQVNSGSFLESFLGKDLVGPGNVSHLEKPGAQEGNGGGQQIGGEGPGCDAEKLGHWNVAQTLTGHLVQMQILTSGSGVGHEGLDF